MEKFKQIILLLVLIFISATGNAQGDNVEMAEAMAESGKIYVVVAVVLIIFAGIIIYLINLDQKIGKIEKQLK